MKGVNKNKIEEKNGKNDVDLAKQFRIKSILRPFSFIDTVRQLESQLGVKNRKIFIFQVKYLCIFIESKSSILSHKLYPVESVLKKEFRKNDSNSSSYSNRS